MYNVQKVLVGSSVLLILFFTLSPVGGAQLTCVLLLLLAGQSLLQGQLSVQLHAFALLLSQGRGSRGRGGVDRTLQVIREALSTKWVWVLKDLQCRSCRLLI